MTTLAEPSTYELAVLHALTACKAPLEYAFHDAYRTSHANNPRPGFVARIVFQALGIRAPLYVTLRSYKLSRGDWWREGASTANGYSDTNYMLSPGAVMHLARTACTVKAKAFLALFDLTVDQLATKFSPAPPPPPPVHREPDPGAVDQFLKAWREEVLSSFSKEITRAAV
jgi:hypothetical protein